MRSPQTLPLLVAGVLGLGYASSLHAATGLDWIDKNTNLTFYADIRLRYEVDWDSQTAGGAPRDDRNRGRIRARFGANYQLSEEWSTGLRVRTGNSRSQQSPHLTFVSDDHVRDDVDFVLDRYFLQYKSGRFSGWGGRNVTPFWQQNELFWDEDVTPTGVAATFEEKWGGGTLTAVGGAFMLPDGGYDLNGQMIAGQLRYGRPIQKSQITAAAGLFYMHGDSGAHNLRNRNGDRDYTIGVANLQWSIPIRKTPVSLGVDVFNNFQDYDAADAAPLAAVNADETFGYALSATLGQLKQKHDWLLGYTWAHVETFAVNASFAQDDWARFGSATQSDCTDIEGHEIRAGYVVSKNINVLARFYMVEAITTGQNGNRFRVDLNWKF